MPLSGKSPRKFADPPAKLFPAEKGEPSVDGKGDGWGRAGDETGGESRTSLASVSRVPRTANPRVRRWITSAVCDAVCNGRHTCFFFYISSTSIPHPSSLRPSAGGSGRRTKKRPDTPTTVLRRPPQKRGRRKMRHSSYLSWLVFNIS